MKSGRPRKLGIAKDTRGGDDNTSRLVLLPLKHLFMEINGNTRN